MLSGETLNMVDNVCREIKQDSKPFGGIQVVFSGDFFQLPPVVKKKAENLQTTLIEKPPSIFAYDSSSWIDLNPLICYLTDQYRQDDKDFIEILSSIRCNTFNDKQLNFLISRKTTFDSKPKNAVELYSHNADVDYINSEILSKIPNETHRFDMTSEGYPNIVKSLKEDCISPEILNLKIGAWVIFTRNNPEMGFFNGTAGMVKNYNKESGYPVVELHDGQKITVKPMDWTFEENNIVMAKITQIPLRLAWAITVHKSQGMNLDEAMIDLSKTFEYGQGYVALSRLRRLSGLYLLGWNEKAFQVNPLVINKDNYFRIKSDDIETQLLKTSLNDLQKKQLNFIDCCRNRNDSNKANALFYQFYSESGYSFEGNQNKTNRVSNWNTQNDDRLCALYDKGLTIENISLVFNKTEEFIKTRIQHLYGNNMR